MNMLMRAAAMMMKGVDIMEVFSPERVVKEAARYGLTPGWSLDLKTGWDLNREEDRRRAKDIIEKDQPLLVVGSPVCTPFSRLHGAQLGKKCKD